MNKRTSFTINDLPRAERPRERLKKFGAEALSTQEILALILGRGSSGESVLVTSQRLLSNFGNIEQISKASLEELAEVKGIGEAKASQIKACFELARRKEENVDETIKIRSEKDVFKLIKAKLKDKKKEYFLILSLDKQSRLIKMSNITIGTLDTNLVHPREVFKEAIQALASSIILVHNHPSGSIEPSESDLKITGRIVETGNVVGIEVVDHLIVSGDKYLSFKGKGLI